MDLHNNMADNSPNMPGDGASPDTKPGRLAVTPSTAPQHSASRRAFLRGAVIGSTAVAAVGGATGVALASGSPAPRILKQLIGVAEAASGETFAGCFEDTMFVATTTFNVHQNGESSPGSFFLFFTAHNLLAGTYTITIDPTPGTGTSPFELQSSGGNPAKLFQLTANTASNCPTSQLTGEVEGDVTIAALFPYTFSGANQDLQLQVHLKWHGTAPAEGVSEDVSFTAKLFHGATLITTVLIPVTAVGVK